MSNTVAEYVSLVVPKDNENTRNSARRAKAGLTTLKVGIMFWKCVNLSRSHSRDRSIGGEGEGGGGGLTTVDRHGTFLLIVLVLPCVVYFMCGARVSVRQLKCSLSETITPALEIFDLAN